MENQPRKQEIRSKIDKIVSSILLQYGQNENKKYFISELCDRLYKLKKSLKYDRFEQVNQTFSDIVFLFHFNEVTNRNGIEYFFMYYKPILKNLNFDIQTLNHIKK